MQEKSDALTGKRSNAPNQNWQPAQDSFSDGAPATAVGRSPSSAPNVGSAETSSGALEQAKQTLTTAADKFGNTINSGFDTQKGKAADSLGTVAQALRQSSEQLRKQNEGAAVPEYVASAASQVERLSGYLRSTNSGEIVASVEQFARRQPALFIGGAFMLGILGARFLKSSSQSIPSAGSPTRNGVGGE
jgi:hypothetical protein